MSKPLDPANWKPNPNAQPDKRPHETYSVDAEADSTVIKALINKLESRMLDADVEIMAREVMRQSLIDERSWLNPGCNRTLEDKLFAFKPSILRQGLRTLFNFQPRISGTNRDSLPVALTCDSFEKDRIEILGRLTDYLNARCKQAKSIRSSSAPKWRQVLLLAQQLLSDASIYDKMLSLADEATFVLESDLAFGGKPESRAAAGGLQPSLRKKKWKLTQAQVANDFDQTRLKKLSPFKTLGACPVSKIKAWDKKYPDANHPHPDYGYHADMRRFEKYQPDYELGKKRWNAHWLEYAFQLRKWRRTHPRSPLSDFRFKQSPTLTYRGNIDACEEDCDE